MRHNQFCDLVCDRAPKRFCADSKLKGRTPAGFDRTHTFRSQSGVEHVHFCDLACNRVTKRARADSHDAHLLGSTAVATSHRRVAWGTFTFAALSAIASRSVFAQTHMTHACVVRPLSNLQIAKQRGARLLLSPCLRSQSAFFQTHMARACSAQPLPDLQIAE
jgi:hypothetical protein